MTDIDPDLKNRRAMNEINVNARLREAKKEMAEADKILAVKRAEADAESKSPREDTRSTPKTQ